jgi:hypothetical protein
LFPCSSGLDFPLPAKLPVGVGGGVPRRASPGLRLADVEDLNQGRPMSKLLRGLAAGWGAKKLGGGCISTVLIFLLLWWLLGNFEVFR